MNLTEKQSPVDILLVEDNPADVRLTMEVLKEGKIYSNLHVVNDGEEAMTFLEKSGKYEDVPRPDLILLDLNLPRKDGREVLAIIKSDPDLRQIPVVVLTTSRNEDDIQKIYDLHGNCFITKPVDLDQFIHVIKTINNFWLKLVEYPSRSS